MNFKILLYGWIPYFFYRIFSPESPKITCYKFIVKRGYKSHFLYDFTLDYDRMPIQVYRDGDNELNYVLHTGNKKLYFPRGYTRQKIEKMYRSLLIEQDIRSPHHYVDSVEELRGKVLLDIGGAEGMTSLDSVDLVSFIYIFECEPEWIEALLATFAPWKDKISIVEKYISNRNDATNQTLDDFFKDKPKDNLFLKMDIEGEERNALAGSEKLFSMAKNLQFAICTYHKKDDKKIISFILDKYNCKYKARDGFFYHRHKLRVCLLRGAGA